MAGWYVKVTTTQANGQTDSSEMSFAKGEDVTGKIKGWLDWAMLNATDEFEIHISPVS